jgi:hypothetical protein
MCHCATNDKLATFKFQPLPSVYRSLKVKARPVEKSLTVKNATSITLWLVDSPESRMNVNFFIRFNIRYLLISSLGGGRP